LTYLLTSGGISNATILNKVKSLLTKPISECKVLCIPTSSYGMRHGFKNAYEFVFGTSGAPMCEVGWGSIGILELSVLPSLDVKDWIEDVTSADVILVNGGDPGFLAYWMRQSGLDKILPTLSSLYIGMSAGSMVLTPDFGKAFIQWTSKDGDDRPLGLVPFSIFPHLNHPGLPDNNEVNARKWAKTLSNEAYMIDDASAILVEKGQTSILSEGTWAKI
jgi:dipeptidase E